MNILLVQPDWPRPKRMSQSGPSKYFPFPLIKLAALYRSQGHRVALVLDRKPEIEPENAEQMQFSVMSQDIPMNPDVICFTTSMSYWFYYVKRTIERYMAAYPLAEIRIGGVHATMAPDVYRAAFPQAYVHVGPVPEAEKVEPAWDLLGADVDTQIIRFHSGCTNSCSFCSARLEKYEVYDPDEVLKKVRFTKLILNDNNFMTNPNRREILTKLADMKVGGRPIQQIEIQGGLDVRALHKELDIIPLMKASRVKNIRLAYDQGLWMGDMVEKCISALDAASYDARSLRVYILYNHDLPFDIVMKKLEQAEKWRVGPIHSRFRPITLLHDGYISQKKAQPESDYYIHPGWTDKMVRVVGSLSSGISKMVRANVPSLDDVRAYYGQPSVKETLEMMEVA